MDPEHYYREFALAYVRGNCPELAEADEQCLLRAARKRGLKLQRFKRTAGLPRVRRVIGALKGFGPHRLLDIGTGRGAFLWPLLDEMPKTDVTAVDVLAHRVDDINAVRRGGVPRVQAELHDAETLPWENDTFDAVTVLEVLEHVRDPQPVAEHTLRLARDVVIATVPAKEDDNPEHIRLFTRRSLEALFRDAGARDVRIEHVLNHMVAVVMPCSKQS